MRPTGLRSNVLADHPDPLLRQHGDQAQNAQRAATHVGDRFRIEEIEDTTGIATGRPGGRFFALRFQDATGAWKTLLSVDQDTGNMSIAGLLNGGQHVRQWLASRAAGVGDLACPVTPNGHRYKCTTAGTTGGSEPTWPLTAGATVNDNGTIWTEDGAPGANFTATGRNPAT